MNKPHISARELQESDIELVADYWSNASDSYLIGMGVDISKMPSRRIFLERLMEQINSPYEAKKAYCIIWTLDQQPVGHSNVNPIVFGEEAYMHLHMWKRDTRQRGLGTELVKMTLPFFFENLQLKKLFCEPYALNSAPNKALEKAGFEFVKEYVTVPGAVGFEQPVKRWELSREKFMQMRSAI